MKLKERWRAIALRKKGWMLPAIRTRLGVSKSTVSLWLRDIELTEDQRKRLIKGRDYSRFMAGEKKKKVRMAITKELFDRGAEEGRAFSNDSFFVTGTMLYWAEGAKTGTSLKFSNSDPIMIAFMMLWFRKTCKVPDNKFRISLHIHNLHIRRGVELYWSKITNIPRTQFYKTQVKKSTLGQRRNVLYNGTCTICISDVSLFRKMIGWRAGVLSEIGPEALMLPDVPVA